MIIPKNIFHNIPENMPEEFFEDIIQIGNMKLERIISRGHVTPEGQWYDQDTDEWVLLLKGRARIRLEADPQPIDLQPGDHIRLPAHVRHRVEWTDPETETIWLALHY